MTTRPDQSAYPPNRSSGTRDSAGDQDPCWPIIVLPVESCTVVRHVLAGRHQDVADPRQDLGPNLPEPAGDDRLIARRDPRPGALDPAPVLDEAHRVRGGLEVQLQAARLPGDEPDAREQFRHGVHEHVRRGGDVDHAVIGGDQQSGARPDPFGGGAHGGIRLLERARELRRIASRARARPGRVRAHTRRRATPARRRARSRARAARRWTPRRCSAPRAARRG